MGFDVVLYDRKRQKLEVFELSESLHNAIFSSSMLWGSYLELRKLSDYYLTDETFSGDKLRQLISNLNNYRSNIPNHKQNDYQEFIVKISDSKVSSVHIAGD
ncbi:hypothetical protein [Bacillus solimangrovi]|uniref:Uncharacterized protein n=1 Tax=Bacillus solimangrovi TaxID=1305675 RepID=A0A1E5LAN3_9BACI|nr:hypothetical protein [Bacillus solimangrovi]OEH91123.1 hypothetical protein BFG57_07055 [Bacillus solimangrovi]